MRPGEIASKGMNAKNQASQFAKKAAIAGDLKQKEERLPGDCKDYFANRESVRGARQQSSAASSQVTFLDPKLKKKRSKRLDRDGAKSQGQAGKSSLVCARFFLAGAGLFSCCCSSLVLA